MSETKNIPIAKIETNKGQIEGKNPKHLHVCQTCGKTFYNRNVFKGHKPKFCSPECAAEAKKKYKVCPQCGKRFADWTKEKFCSLECSNASRRGITFPDEWRQHLSEGRKASPKCHGENLYNWKGGKATELQRFRIHNAKQRSPQKMPIDVLRLVIMRKIQNGKCFYCDGDLGQGEIEHLTPLSRGGDNYWHNLVWSCTKCNSEKRSKTLEEYAIKKGKLWLIDRYDYLIATTTIIYDKIRRNNRHSVVETGK